MQEWGFLHLQASASSTELGPEQDSVKRDKGTGSLESGPTSWGWEGTVHLLTWKSYDVKMKQPRPMQAAFLQASFEAEGTLAPMRESGLQARAAGFFPGRRDGLMRYYLQSVLSYAQERPGDECI